MDRHDASNQGQDSATGWRVKSVRCPHCGAPKLTPYRSPYIYCDHCANLIDYDYQVSLRQAAEQPEEHAQYQRLAARCQPEIDKARVRGDRKRYARFTREKYQGHMELFPEAYPPRVRDPEYRAGLVAFYVDSFVEYAFDDELWRLQERCDKRERAIAWCDDGCPDSTGFRRTYEAYRDMIRACAAKYQRIGLLDRHPDPMTEARYVRFEMSKYLSAWLNHVHQADLQWMLQDAGVATEYRTVEPLELQRRHCGRCGAELDIVPQAKRVVCEEGCGHVLAVDRPELGCSQCGAPLSIPVDVRQLNCPSCRALVVV